MSRRTARGRPRPWHIILVLLFAPSLLHAAGGGQHLPDFLLVIAAMLAVGKLFGEGAERLGLPPVLGELLAGLILGPGLLGIVPGADAAPIGLKFLTRRRDGV